MKMRSMLSAEQKYSYTQSTQIICQTGCIGHLQGDTETDGNGFFTTWTDHYSPLKTDSFKLEFDKVITALRKDPDFGHVLENRAALAKFCGDHSERRMGDGISYGLRVDTDEHAYLCRFDPVKGEYKVYAYKKDWLDHHMKAAEAGIRFIDSHYNDKFRIQDGGRIRITEPSGKETAYVCRYIDPYHMEVGSWLCHICEFAEVMEKNGNVVEQYDPVGGKADEDQNR